MSLSVLILTKNEERDLPHCLASVRWASDIVVYDSFSSDATLKIAAKAGARVVQRAFDDWSTHQNWGLRNISFKNPWVLYLDADERVTVELRARIEETLARTPEVAAFQIRRRDFMDGRWLRHVQASPYYIRLFRPERIRYERLVNPVTIVDGGVTPLEGYLDHFPFSKGYAHWIARHNEYSTLEAREILEGGEVRGRLFDLLAERDFQKRRRVQKRLFYKLPFRPILKFVVLYFGKLGFLDGRPGFTYALLQSIYEYFISLKVKELRRQKRG